MIVKIKKLYEDAKIPIYGTPEAACADLYAYLLDNNKYEVQYDEEDKAYVDIHPNDRVKIGTGVAMELPDCYCALIYARSGLATNQGLAMTNGTGVIDNDFRNEFIVPIINNSEYTQRIYHGERIAQVMFVPYIQANFIPTDCLSETKRGLGGFGSTGTM